MSPLSAAPPASPTPPAAAPASVPGTPAARPVVERSYSASLAALLGAQKSAQGAPAYSRFVNRPLGRRLAALAHVAGATPNQVTAASAVASGLGVLALAVLPYAWWLGPLVALLLVLGYALDAADGQLARLRGGGSKSGEWLDHVVDSAKMVTLHLAVAVGAYLHWSPAPRAWLLVPLAFSAISSTWFFTIILNDHLRRLAGTRDVQATVTAGEARRHSRLRSVLSAPVDYGVLCVLFLVIGWPAVFAWAYGLLFVGFALITAASMVVWYRAAASLDPSPTAAPVTASAAAPTETRSAP